MFLHNRTAAKTKVRMRQKQGNLSKEKEEGSKSGGMETVEVKNQQETKGDLSLQLKKDKTTPAPD